MSNGTYKVAYTVTERNGKSYWRQIGIVFTNRDGSMTVKLDALPCNGELVIKDPQPREER